MAEVILPKIFSDNAVLQRDQPIKIFGKTVANTMVSVKLGDSTETTKSITNGEFVVMMPAQTTNFDVTLEIFVNGELSKIIKHLQIGEVWLNAGQSNMNLALRYDHDYQVNAKNILSEIGDASISYFEVPKIVTDEDKQNTKLKGGGCWQRLSFQNAEQFSAASYYFALKLSQKIPDVPIGIIWMAFDGTTASSWTSQKYLSQNPVLKSVFLDSYEDVLLHLSRKDYDKYLEATRIRNQRQEVGNFWDKVLKGEIPHQQLQEAFKNNHSFFGDYVMGPSSENRPHALYDNMVSTIAGYTIRGVNYYQGESDDTNAGIYDILLANLINNWRDEWQMKIPFTVMQLAPFKHWFGSFDGRMFPTLRHKQQQVANALTDVYLTNVMDHGEEWDIHPKEKRIVGERFALVAFDRIYRLIKHGEAPSIDRVMLNSNEISITFNNANQLHANADIEIEVLRNGVVADYEARLQDNMLIIGIDNDENDNLMINYLQNDYIVATIFNENGIPVSPFSINL